MKTTGNDDVAEYYATILLSILICFNIYSSISFVYILTGVKIDLGQGSKLITGLLAFGLMVLFYFLLVFKNKYLEIANEYKHETSKTKNIGTALIISYIIVSIGLLMLCMYLMIQKNRGYM